LLFDRRRHTRNRGQTGHFAGDDFHLRESREFVRTQHALDAPFLKLLRPQRRDDYKFEGIGERGSVYHRTIIA